VQSAALARQRSCAAAARAARGRRAGGPRARHEAAERPQRTCGGGPRRARTRPCETPSRRCRRVHPAPSCTHASRHTLTPSDAQADHRAQAAQLSRGRGGASRRSGRPRTRCGCRCAGFDDGRGGWGGLRHAPLPCCCRCCAWRRRWRGCGPRSGTGPRQRRSGCAWPTSRRCAVGRWGGGRVEVKLPPPTPHPRSAGGAVCSRETARRCGTSGAKLTPSRGPQTMPREAAARPLSAPAPATRQPSRPPPLLLGKTPPPAALLTPARPPVWTLCQPCACRASGTPPARFVPAAAAAGTGTGDGSSSSSSASPAHPFLVSTPPPLAPQWRRAAEAERLRRGSAGRMVAGPTGAAPHTASHPLVRDVDRLTVLADRQAAALQGPGACERHGGLHSGMSEYSGLERRTSILSIPAPLMPRCEASR